MCSTPHPPVYDRVPAQAAVCALPRVQLPHHDAKAERVNCGGDLAANLSRRKQTHHTKCSSSSKDMSMLLAAKQSKARPMQNLSPCATTLFLSPKLVHGNQLFVLQTTKQIVLQTTFNVGKG